MPFTWHLMQSYRIEIERVLHDQIFPVITDDLQRTDRLIGIYATLNEKQRRAFKSVLDRQNMTMSNMKLYLEYCDKYNVCFHSVIYLHYKGGIMDKDETEIKTVLQTIIHHITRTSTSKWADIP